MLEIDGASNNNVEEVRTLRENVKFSPSKGKYKIYIIDEVHMLSTAAFNALLKTLEEPPAHVKFIFATTEGHKVLATIMSRCQRFDFKRISPKMLLSRIMSVAKKEKIDLDEKAALLIARASDGSLRDALVLLDQMISFSENRITAEDVVELLGIVHKDRIFELSDAIIDCKGAKVAVVLDEMIDSGKDPVFIANSLIGHFRDLMILKTAGSPTSDMAFSDEELKVIDGQLKKLTVEEILYILQNLSHCITLMRGAVLARAPLEIAAIRLTKRASIFALSDILAKLEERESDTARPSPPERTEPAKPARESYAGVSPDRDVLSRKTEEDVQDRSADMKSDDADTEDNGNSIPEQDFLTPEAHWKAVLSQVKGSKMSVYTFLSPAKIVEFNQDKVIIGFGKDHNFNKDAMEAEINRTIVEEAIKKVTGKTPKLKFQTLELSDDAEKQEAEKSAMLTRTREVMNPVIDKAMDIFGGNVVRGMTEVDN